MHFLISPHWIRIIIPNAESGGNWRWSMRSGSRREIEGETDPCDPDTGGKLKRIHALWIRIQEWKLSGYGTCDLDPDTGGKLSGSMRSGSGYRREIEADPCDLDPDTVGKLKRIHALWIWIQEGNWSGSMQSGSGSRRERECGSGSGFTTLHWSC